MCGIAGTVTTSGQADARLAKAMADRLHLRGPDDQGIWQHGNVALAHRRLAIVDLSPSGHQPMTSHDGRWSLAFNGEIYNAERLRAASSFSAWRGSSDTEVLLHTIAEMGVAAAVQHLVGMFAFAAFDNHKQELWLCRDRLGIKPLYYGWVDGTFVFASDMHALRLCGTGLTINRAAVATFLRHGYITSPATIYNEINKQVPGTLLCLQTKDAVPGEAPRCQTYWSIRDHATVDDAIDADEAERELHTRLREAVKDRLVADVPLGGFLSGGYDSSLVCALMQEQSNTRVRTFTIGFDDPRYNEAQHAKQIAAHLGTDHTELYVSEQDMLDAVAQLPQLCDEPFADVSILPTFVVSRMARDQVTVALSGDGGDELFWGYNRYDTAAQLWRKLRRVPAPFRNTASYLFQHPLTQSLTRHVPAPAWGGRQGPLSQKLRTAGELLHDNGHRALYHNLMSHWRKPEEVCLGAEELTTPFNDETHWTLAYPEVQRMALQDTLAYLPDDVLTKVDRASMAVSLEARVPLLDHRVVEFVSRLPGHLRKRPGENKYLLRKILDQYVPRSLTERPKMGFGAPLETWLRGPLREWAEDLLDESRIEQENLLRAKPIRQLWQSHQGGKANNAARLWNVIMLQAWLSQGR